MEDIARLTPEKGILQDYKDGRYYPHDPLADPPASPENVGRRAG